MCAAPPLNIYLSFPNVPKRNCWSVYFNFSHPLRSPHLLYYYFDPTCVVFSVSSKYTPAPGTSVFPHLIRTRTSTPLDPQPRILLSLSCSLRSWSPISQWHSLLPYDCPQSPPLVFRCHVFYASIFHLKCALSSSPNYDTSRVHHPIFLIFFFSEQLPRIGQFPPSLPQSTFVESSYFIPSFPRIPTRFSTPFNEYPLPRTSSSLGPLTWRVFGFPLLRSQLLPFTGSSDPNRQ